MLQPVTKCYNQLQNVTTSYKTLQPVTKCYNQLQNFTSYKTLQPVTKCYNQLQNITTSYKMLQPVTKCYNQLQNVTTSYKMLQPVTKCYKINRMSLLAVIRQQTALNFEAHLNSLYKFFKLPREHITLQSLFF